MIQTLTGIVVLLLISVLVSRSHQFRRRVGGVALVCLTAAALWILYHGPSPGLQFGLPWLTEQVSEMNPQDLLQKMKERPEAATDRTNPPSSPSTTATLSTPPALQHRLIRIDATGKEQQDTERILKEIGKQVEKYLALRRQSTELGIQLVEPRHLDWRLLRLTGREDGHGGFEATVVFDETFNSHVTTRARQLETRRRLTRTIYPCCTIVAGLAVTYGLLRWRQRRYVLSPAADDHLAVCRITMV